MQLNLSQEYHFESKLQNLSQEYPEKFIITPLWKEYAHVIEFLDSGHCWAEMTDSGSMQEELLYFPDVLSLTVRLNTDRPETVFDAKSNALVPPINPQWIASIVKETYTRKEALGIVLKNKKSLYGQSGQVSKSIVEIIKKELEMLISIHGYIKKLTYGEKNNCLTICKILHMTICNHILIAAYITFGIWII
jgi:UDP-N-acetylglucosamine 2-epimerase